MARTLSGLELTGRIVYEAFNPQKVGKIIATGSPRYPGSAFKFVVVKWLRTGETEKVDEGRLNDMEGLVEETERKAVKHRAAFEKARREL